LDLTDALYAKGDLCINDGDRHRGGGCPPTPATHVLTASLFERFASCDLDLFQNKVLSAMRFGFGGHVETVETK
jgi:hypothetical protein